jgi:hypothetical protein
VAANAWFAGEFEAVEDRHCFVFICISALNLFCRLPE